MDYEEFEKYFKENPDLDNAEYYDKFPDVNKSTIRSWKSKALKPAEPELDITPEEVEKFAGFEEQQKDYIKLLMIQTKTKPQELQGLDPNNQILVLKNKLKAIEQEKPKARGTNSSILPSPAPVGSNVRKFGIDKYIVFDTNLNEIRMEIPLEKLMDPEENKKIRSEIK